MSDQPQVIAEFVDYRGLVDGLRACREIRDISFDTLDEITDSADGYFSKTLAVNGLRRITINSIGLALCGLGVKCLIVEDPAQWDRVQRVMDKRGGISKRNKNLVRGGTMEYRLSRRFFRQIQNKGRASRWKKMGPAERAEWARRMNEARWRKSSIKRDRQAIRADRARKKSAA